MRMSAMIIDNVIITTDHMTTFSPSKTLYNGWRKTYVNRRATVVHKGVKALRIITWSNINLFNFENMNHNTN